MITPVILWSDFLIFILLGILVFAIYLAKKNVIIKNSWSKIYQHPSKIIAMLVLVVFALIGILDSLHFKRQEHDATVTMRSFLDVLLEPISNHTETSYSAPFATNLFIKTMQKEPDGNITWIAEPLQHVKPAAISRILLQGSIDAVLSIAIMSMLIWLYMRKQHVNYNFMNMQMITAWCTLSVIIFVIACIGHLIKHYHIFGTDKIGVDVFYFALKSIRTGLIIGTLTTMLTLPFAVILGAMAGYYRGWIDDAIQYLYTTLSSIPGVLLIAAAMLSLETFIMRHTNFFGSGYHLSDVRLLLLCTILGITSWTTLCRILRGETLKLREQGFVLAARAIGLSSMQIIRKHIVPNLLHIILIAIILDFSSLVLAEAVLSYVGVGVDSSMFSWGNMINGARMEMGRDPVIWWSLAGAFLLMFTLVLAANIFADGVRDAFDPRVK